MSKANAYSGFTPEELHEQLEGCVKFFTRSVRAGDGPTASYWLVHYHAIWDELEALGVSLNIPLPLTDPLYITRRAATDPTFKQDVIMRNWYINQLCWPKASLTWGSSFEEPRRGK